MSNLPLKILLVEDDEDDYILVRDLLAEISPSKYDLKWVSAYKEVMETLDQVHYDIYLLDYRLGGDQSGLELLNEMIAQGCKAPIILLTGHSDYRVDMEAMKIGAADYLVKGQINARTLERSLRYAVERKRIEEELRLNEARFEALFQLSQMVEASLQEIADFVLDQAVRLTKSKIGCLGFVNEDGTVLSAEAWSKNVMEEGTARDCPDHIFLDPTVFWALAAKEHTAVIINNYSEWHKKGYYGGDLPLTRFMSIPIMEGHQVVGIAIVANKEDAYDASDVRQLTLLADGMWKLIQKKRADETLRESESQLRILSSKLFSIQEEERARLAQELHDSTGQTLAAIKFSVENALKMAGRGKAQAMAKSLKALVPVIQGALEKVRSIYMGLRPTILDDFGIVAAIGWYCREFEKTYPSIHIERKVDVQESDVPEPLRIVIFRVMQEALNNAARHSNANLAGLSLVNRNGNLQLTIEDDGQGFDIQKIVSEENRRRGLGLLSMKEQAELFGGSFSIESGLGEGTMVKISWPRKYSPPAS